MHKQSTQRVFIRLIAAATITLSVAQAQADQHPISIIDSAGPTLDSTPPPLTSNLPNNTQHAKAHTKSTKHSLSDGEIAGIAVGGAAGAGAAIRSWQMGSAAIRSWQTGSGKLNLTGSLGVRGEAPEVTGQFSSLSDRQLRQVAREGVEIEGKTVGVVNKDGKIIKYTQEDGRIAAVVNEAGKVETVSINAASREELVLAINQPLSRDYWAPWQQPLRARAERLALVNDEWAGRTRLSGLIPKSKTRVRFGDNEIREFDNEEEADNPAGVNPAGDNQVAAEEKAAIDETDDAEAPDDATEPDDEPLAAIDQADATEPDDEPLAAIDQAEAQAAIDDADNAQTAQNSAGKLKPTSAAARDAQKDGGALVDEDKAEAGADDAAAADIAEGGLDAAAADTAEGGLDAAAAAADAAAEAGA